MENNGYKKKKLIDRLGTLKWIFSFGEFPGMHTAKLCMIDK